MLHRSLLSQLQVIKTDRVRKEAITIAVKSATLRYVKIRVRSLVREVDHLSLSSIGSTLSIYRLYGNTASIGTVRILPKVYDSVRVKAISYGVKRKYH